MPARINIYRSIIGARMFYPLTLICSNHDAVFDAETGEGLGGHGQGCQLDPVPLETVGGRIFIAK